MARKFNLHHRKHTGKLLHHRHTHYPALLAMLAIAVILIFFTGRIAQADDLLLTATVPAPIPAGAPTFTSPSDNTVTTTPSVQFEGTCPVITPAIVVVLYEGTTQLGSGICSADGTFQITASLTPGLHSLVATVVTITNGVGESSPPFHITYRPTSASTGSGTDTVAPLDIISEKPFLTFSRQLPAEWSGRFAGGVPPYAITIDWGDGTIEHRSVHGNDLQTFTHRYSRLQTYTVSITLSDQSGLSLTRQYVAVSPASFPVGTSNAPNIGAMLDIVQIDPYSAIYLIYLCILLLMLLMWRNEHLRHMQRPGLAPLYYPWQRPAARRRRRS